MEREGVLAKAKVPWEGGRWCSKTNMGEQEGGWGGAEGGKNSGILSERTF